MIAPIRPPLIKPPRRRLRETPLERARRAVAESLLSDADNNPNPRRTRRLLWAAAGAFLAATLAAVAGYLAGH